MARNNSAHQHYARINHNNPDAPRFIEQALVALQPRVTPEDVLVLCIGTDRSTGDSLGPLIGSLLKKQCPRFQVRGCLEHPVHAANLQHQLELINATPPAWTVAIDASLGNIDAVGMINIGQGKLQPGAGVNKDLPSVGNVYITGVVNVGGFMEYFVLQNTRLSLVVKMSEIICSALLNTFSTKKELAGTR